MTDSRAAFDACYQRAFATVDWAKPHDVREAVARACDAFAAEVRREALREATQACGAVTAAQRRQTCRDVGIDCMNAIHALNHSLPGEKL
jgi:hypothetical protein